MTTAWRITKQKHQSTGLSGEGARIYGGRWNPIGINEVSYKKFRGQRSGSKPLNPERLDGKR
jgi:hypothetical protein